MSTPPVTYDSGHKKIAINDVTGCWEWRGFVRKDGYAVTSRGGRSDYVHRFFFETARGVIPEGLVIDHKCKVRHCCNPDHLEAVSQSVNVRRGNLPLLAGEWSRARAARQTHCKRGHEFTEENTYHCRGKRVCRECSRAKSSRYNKKRRGR